MKLDLPHTARYFSDAYESWKEGIAHITLQYIAVLVEEKWVISRATLILSPHVVEHEKDEQVSTASLIVGRLQKNVNSLPLDPVVEQFLQGSILIRDQAFELPKSDGLEFYSPWAHPEPNYFISHLQVTPSKTQPLPHYVDVPKTNFELRAGNVPFDGILDLFSYFGFGELDHIPYDQRMSIELHPPADIFLEHSSLEDNTLTATFAKTLRYDASKLRVGLRIFPDPSLSRRMQVAEEIEWTGTDRSFEYGVLKKYLENSTVVEVMTSASGLSVSRHFISDRKKTLNPRARAYNLLDPGYKTLKENLFCPPKESRNLEPAIATLLHLLGAASTRPIGTDSVDVFAETKGGRLAIIECTTRVTEIRTKVGKLVNRRYPLTNSVESNPAYNDVLAILIVNIPREQIVDEEYYLIINQVLLIAKEELERAIDLIETPPNLDLEFSRAKEMLQNKLLATESKII